MKKIIFICPYFGKMPKQQMELWIQSCRLNPSIDWLVVTDDRTEYLYPPNIKVKYCSFLEIKNYIQKKFDFQIQLETPYKLCDFKPAYGYIFSEFISEYDFWGHCDMTDCIFGNVRKFLTEELLDANDKIGFLGHMTLYRNTDEVNERFKLMTQSGVKLEEILGAKRNMAFDELPSYGINAIYREYGFPCARVDQMYVDISPLRFAFQATAYDENYMYFCRPKNPMIIKWNDGQLFECTVKDGEVVEREIGYVHFQKRNMGKKFTGEVKQYYIIPNCFIDDLGEVDSKKIKGLSRDKVYSVFFKLEWEAVKFHVYNLFRKVKIKEVS